LKTEALEGARKGNPVNFCRAFAHHAKITTKLIALRFFLPRQVSRKSAIVDSGLERGRRSIPDAGRTKAKIEQGNTRMARTWSVPQRGSYAVLAAPAVARHERLFAQLAAMGRADPQRGLLLLVAAALTIIAVAVPHLADESLSSLLFLAGAGLAAILFWAPSESISSSPSKRAARNTAAPLPAAKSKSIGPASFAELVVRPGTAPAFDRAQWAKLTAHMSHELRTPLNAVLGFSEMMSNEVFGPLGSSCYSAYARDIHASGLMLLKSAEDALAITTLLTSPDQQGGPQACRLSAAAEDACAFARHGLSMKSITIVSDIGADTDVIGDAQAMRQMLINLIAEAARNARQGTTLAMTADCTTDAIRLSITVPGGDVEAASQEDGFPVILARTLCELSGARLARGDAADGSRQWTVHFLPVAQNDLFCRANQI
jgi:signal transduction histidine kinase